MICISGKFERQREEVVLLKDEEEPLIIEPIKSEELLSLLSSWTPLDDLDDLPCIKDLAAEPVDL